MKKVFLLASLFIASISFSQQYKIVTSVESIVPAGLGRSRIIENQEEVNSDAFTTERTEGKDGGGQRGVRRRDAKIDNFDETKLLNFYSAVGINFQNIASNDALIGDKINGLIAKGWELAFVVSGVESNSGKEDGEGIFITRYIFKKQ